MEGGAPSSRRGETGSGAAEGLSQRHGPHTGATVSRLPEELTLPEKENMLLWALGAGERGEAARNNHL